jgi:hypothetical protein
MPEASDGVDQLQTIDYRHLWMNKRVYPVPGLAVVLIVPVEQICLILVQRLILTYGRSRAWRSMIDLLAAVSIASRQFRKFTP